MRLLPPAAFDILGEPRKRDGKGPHIMTLTKLIYTSEHPALDYSDLDEVLRVARVNNVRDNITGALVVSEDRFLQLLEGERRVVSDCFLRISQDTRHQHLQIVTSGEATDRLFGEWSMHRIETGAVKDEIMRQYAVSDAFDPSEMSVAAIEDMLRTLAAGGWKRPELVA